MNDKALREALTVDHLAQLIRMADPKHEAGAGELAEKILPWIFARLEAALASQPEQAPFPLSDIEIEKVIAKIRPVVDSEFINGIHPNAQTQTNLVLTALKQVLEERVAAPAPAEEAGTLEAAVEWVLNDATYKAPELIGPIAERWIERLRAAGQAAKGGRET